jgi:hypothetical protein
MAVAGVVVAVTDYYLDVMDGLNVNKVVEGAVGG